MFRSWPWWISLVLIAVSVGWFWMLSLDLRFLRVETGTSRALPGIGAASGTIPGPATGSAEAKK